MIEYYIEEVMGIHIYLQN